MGRQRQRHYCVVLYMLTRNARQIDRGCWSFGVFHGIHGTMNLIRLSCTCENVTMVNSILDIFDQSRAYKSGKIGIVFCRVTRFDWYLYSNNHALIDKPGSKKVSKLVAKRHNLLKLPKNLTKRETYLTHFRMKSNYLKINKIMWFLRVSTFHNKSFHQKYLLLHQTTQYESEIFKWS